MSFETKVDNLWTNPHHVDLSGLIVFFIRIIAPDGSEWRHVGYGDAEKQMNDFKIKLRNMESGKRPRSGDADFRLIHYKLYEAIKFDWYYSCHPLAAFDTEKEAVDERRRLKSVLDCNL